MFEWFIITLCGVSLTSIVAESILFEPVRALFGTTRWNPLTCFQCVGFWAGMLTCGVLMDVITLRDLLMEGLSVSILASFLHKLETVMEVVVVYLFSKSGGGKDELDTVVK
jgi:hypothetical protein